MGGASKQAVLPKYPELIGPLSTSPFSKTYSSYPPGAFLFVDLPRLRARSRKAVRSSSHLVAGVSSVSLSSSWEVFICVSTRVATRPASRSMSETGGVLCSARGGFVFGVAVLRLTQGERAAGGTVVTAVSAIARRWFAAGSGKAGMESGVDALRALDARGRLSEVNNVCGKGSSSRRSGHARWGHRRQADNDTLFAGGTCEIRN